MAKEEKKAIDELWRFDCCYNEEIKAILNLIEKLQKENEQLKNEVMKKNLEIIGKEEYIKKLQTSCNRFYKNY